jgi:hypothetical protein
MPGAAGDGAVRSRDIGSRCCDDDRAGADTVRESLATIRASHPVWPVPMMACCHVAENKFVAKFTDSDSAKREFALRCESR